MGILVATLVGVGMFASATGARAADTYGELGHFGAVGTGPGQFKLTGPPSSTTAGTHAFGVDQTDNTVYVGDEPAKREYRIQQLSASGEFLAATRLFAPPNRDGIEGIAIDPVKRRLYVLALERRSESATLDPTRPAAGTLYAFSTEPSGAELVPAVGTTEGVLAGPAELGSQSEAPEGALIDPAGIAVDPTTHDVIMLGKVDLGVSGKGEEPRLRTALQRVHFDGTLGARYIDTTGFFSSEELPNSPIVSSTGAVYLAQNNDVLAQIPSDFTSSSPPTTAIQFTPKGALETDAIAEFDIGEATSDGGGLSFSSAGEGTIYAEGHIFDSASGTTFFPGVLAFADVGGAELGWTGGQNPQSGSGSCTIGFGGVTYPSIAAGEAGTVFVLDAKSGHVLEFGPEGHGCPAAQATAPTATVDGKPLTATETVAPGTPVTFASTLTQANALQVEWDFGDGVRETDDTDEYQHTEVQHAFVRGGELTVTETIHSDDFATPTIVEQLKLSVSSVAVPPTAVLEGPLELTLGQGMPSRLVYLEGGGLGLDGGQGGTAATTALATFDGSASFAANPPGGNQIKSYHWVFGDGTSQTTETPTVTHPYERAGVYKTELIVTDALGLTSQPSVLTVKVNAPALKTEVVHQAAVAAVSPSPIEPPAASLPPTRPAVPAAGLASASLVAKPAGTVQLRVTCPAGETRCAGVVTLRTLHAVTLLIGGSRTHHKRPKATVVTLAAGRFTVAGGRQKSLTLQLTAAARALLAHSRLVRARATLVAHDLAGTARTTELNVALHAPAHVKK